MGSQNLVIEDAGPESFVTNESDIEDIDIE